MRITKALIGGLLCLAGAHSADATVYYSFTSMLEDGIRSFTYTAPDFVTSGTFEAGDLDSCTVMVTPSAHCVSVEFDTSDGVDTIWFGTSLDRVASRVASRAASDFVDPFVFAGGTFNKAGQSWSLDGDATLTIRQSSAPEPASWTMMISGFGLVGVATRRRYRTGLQPA